MSFIPNLDRSADYKLSFGQSSRTTTQQFAQHSLPVLGLGIVLGLAAYTPELWSFLLALLALSAAPSMLRRSNHPLSLVLLLAPIMLFTYVPALSMMRLDYPWLLALYPLILFSIIAYISTFFLFGICRLPRTHFSWGLAAMLSSLLAGLPILGAYQNVSTPGMLLPGPWLVFLGPYSGLALVLLVAAYTNFKVWRSR